MGMKKEVKSLPLTKEKYQKLLNRLEELKRKKVQLRLEGKEANNNMAADTFHSTSRKDFLNQLAMIDSEILQISSDLERAVIIERTNYSQRINIGDVIRLRTTFENEEPEEMWVRLVTYVEGKKERFADGVMSISIASEMGNAILGKLIGDSVVYPIVDGMMFVDILEKQQNQDLVSVNDVVEIIHEQEGYYKEPMTVMVVDQIPRKKIDGITYIKHYEPMGLAILNRFVGEMASYQVDGKKHTVRILDKRSLEEEKEIKRDLVPEKHNN